MCCPHVVRGGDALRKKVGLRLDEPSMLHSNKLLCYNAGRLVTWDGTCVDSLLLACIVSYQRVEVLQL